MSFDLALVNSDLEITNDGTMRTVENTDKLKQDIIKIILTPIGSIKYHPWYGSSISDDLVGQNLPDNMIYQDLSSALSSSLSRLQQLQRAQASYQNVSLSEIIASINDISIQRHVTDPRQIHVVVKVISKDFNAVEEQFSLSP